MEHYARELLNRREINRKHARVHLWNRDQGKFYINNVCFRLERLETNARGYLISREEKQLGCPIPNVVYSLPTKEYEVACNRLYQLFEGRDHFYIRTSRARKQVEKLNLDSKDNYETILDAARTSVVKDSRIVVVGIDNIEKVREEFNKLDNFFEEIDYKLSESNAITVITL